MRRGVFVIAVWWGVVSAGHSSVAGQGLAPSVIWFNGTIITMEGDEVAEAVAIFGDEVVAVGTSSALQTMAGPETEVVDLAGRTMTPGFYAPHDHFPGSGRIAVTQVDLNSPPIGAIETMDDLVEALRVRAVELPDRAWVSGRGYDDTLLAERRHPTRIDLDRVRRTNGMGGGTVDWLGRLERIFTLDCRFRWIRLFLASGKSSNQISLAIS